MLLNSRFLLILGLSRSSQHLWSTLTRCPWRYGTRHPGHSFYLMNLEKELSHQASTCSWPVNSVYFHSAPMLWSDKLCNTTYWLQLLYNRFSRWIRPILWGSTLFSCSRIWLSQDSFCYSLSRRIPGWLTWSFSTNLFSAYANIVTMPTWPRHWRRKFYSWYRRWQWNNSNSIRKRRDNNLSLPVSYFL